MDLIHETIHDSTLTSQLPVVAWSPPSEQMEIGFAHRATDSVDSKVI
jgi:hypothetical protein